MIYTKVQLIWGPATADKLTFILENQTTANTYVVKSISGLDPPPINLSIAELAFEGGVYQGRRPENREIVLTIGFQPNYGTGVNAGDLRKSLYKMLTPKLNNIITFKLLDNSEINWVQTTGHIKRMEANQFSKDPEIQITMTCLSPYFEHGQYTHPTPSSLNGLNPLPITTEGDASTGFLITFGFSSNLTFFKLSNSNGSKLKEG